MKLITISMIFFFFFFFVLLPFAVADLTLGFYNNSCPQAEKIVRAVVQRHINQDGSIVAALLRMQFHDCFVTGCDASILIDPTTITTSEKMAFPNQSLRGFEIIDEAKTLLEQTCPSTVSCADIIALATRDAVASANGPFYKVLTGRRDGLNSDPSLVNIPGPFLQVSQALQVFISKGLNLEDMVTLLGAHTVGFAHCNFFQNRLSSFQGTIDPTMDPALDARLVNICGSFTLPALNNPSFSLDMQTPVVFDNKFYNQILMGRGILQIDQLLALDPSTEDLVSRFAADNDFFKESFANATMKMGSIGVLLGNEGEIRRNCRAFNFFK